jgi:hypothetical protein
MMARMRERKTRTQLPTTRSASGGTRFPLIGEVAPRFFGAPTNRSHRVTLETDALRWSSDAAWKRL